ncbi:unnamed protein product [Owenia fusiformis]|uniref:Uncharacterized protein n=1 Tax=Owenia fusiformis TaxID=6347 RepID=A0A8J1TZX3_OWEFU|nr:unnamed protein product [Owenia fusiformis]
MNHDRGPWMNKTSTLCYDYDLSQFEIGGNELILYITLVLGILISLWILLGNTLVIATYRANRSLHTVGNFYIAQLAIADFLTGMVGLFVIISNTFFPLKWVCSVTYIFIYQFFAIVSLASSLGFLIMISVNRYIAVFCSLRYHSIMSQHKSIIISITVWSLSVIYSMIIMTDFYVYISAYKEEMNVEVECEKSVEIPRITGYSIGIIFLIVLLVHGAIYTMIFKAVRKLQRKAKHSTRDCPNVPVSGANLKLIKTALIIICLFTICWAPFAVSLTIAQYGWLSRVDVNILFYPAYVLAIVNSGMNPVIYGIRSVSYRAGMSKLLRLKIIR